MNQRFPLKMCQKKMEQMSTACKAREVQLPARGKQKESPENHHEQDSSHSPRRCFQMSRGWTRLVEHGVPSAQELQDPASISRGDCGRKRNTTCGRT